MWGVQGPGEDDLHATNQIGNDRQRRESNPGLDHESQPLTIEPFLAPEKCIRGLSVEQLRHTLNIYCSYLQFINMRY